MVTIPVLGAGLKRPSRAPSCFFSLASCLLTFAFWRTTTNFEKALTGNQFLDYTRQVGEERVNARFLRSRSWRTNDDDDDVLRGRTEERHAGITPSPPTTGLPNLLPQRVDNTPLSANVHEIPGDRHGSCGEGAEWDAGVFPMGGRQFMEGGSGISHSLYLYGFRLSTRTFSTFL